MLALILAATVAATPPAPLVLMLEIQMKVGLCERHLNGAQLSHFDPYATPVPEPVQKALQEARVEGRQMAVKQVFTRRECAKLLNMDAI